MREYGKIAPQFWTGTTGRQLRAAGAEAQVVALYLLSCPSANMIGLYYLPLPTLCHETGLTFKGASKALRSLSKAGFAHYDEASEVVFVTEMVRFQVGAQLKNKDHRAIGVSRELAQFKKSRFFRVFFEKYRESFHLDSTAATELLGSPLEAPLEGLGDQDQDQEQEQEQEQERVVVPLALGRRESDRVIEVIAHYRTYHPRSFRRPHDGMKEWHKIATHLANGYEVAELCRVIDWYEHDPWHQGQNDRETKQDSLELYMRDENHIRKGLESPVANGTKRSPLQALLDRKEAQLAEDIKRQQELTNADR